MTTDAANQPQGGPATESAGSMTGLETRPTAELLAAINVLDAEVPRAVARALPAIEALTEAVASALEQGGRLFYIGAGTSGRLGVVDASELPPTFGVPFDMAIGLIAGGDGAIRRAVEFAEDDPEQAWRDLSAHRAAPPDIVIGIAASGRTPYVVGGLKASREAGLKTGCIVCNDGSAVAAAAELPVEVIVGPEFVRGSTRLKAGTAQKLVLNMISTVAMVRLGRVQGNKMVHMQLTNHKLIERGTAFIIEETGLDPETARALLLEYGSVAAALAAHRG